MKYKSKGKRLGAVCLILMLIFIFALPGMGIRARADYENVLDDRLYNNEYLVIRKDPTGKVGKSMNIPIMVRANDRDLEDVWVGLSRDVNSFYNLPRDGSSDSGLRNEYPFEINESTFEPKKLGKIKEGNVKSVTLTARVRRDMEEGYYCIPIAIYLHGKDGSEETDYMNIWIGEQTTSDKETTEETSEDIVFVMGEEQNIPYGMFPEVMDFSINLRNKSQAPAYDVTVSMVLNKSDDEFPFMIYDGNYDRHFDVIEAGEMVGLPYTMAIREDSYTGYYPIKFKISYRESINGSEKTAEGPGAVANAEQGAKASTDTSIQTTDHEFYVHITSKERETEEETRADFNENDRTKARIIVERFRTEPEKIMAGEEFNLILTMKNASTDVAASNILFTLEPEKVENATVFSTESGSSSIVVNSLGAGASAEIQTRFLAKPGIDQRSYTITIKEKYDSPEFKNAEETVSIDIPVYQQARISTSTFEVMPESIEVGQESNIMFGINNTGRVQLYNVNARFEADSIRTVETYVGNIKPGETGNVDLMITGEAATQDEGKIKVIISYEDEGGEVTETEKELTLFVTEPLPMDEFPMEEWENLQGDTDDTNTDIVRILTNPNNRKYVIGAGVVIGVLLIAGVSSFIKHRKRKKQQKEEEEGLDDEIS